MISPCINYMQYPWGYALPMSHIISTRESYPQYPVSHILSTREDMQYPWVISSVPVRICNTRESYPQYLWGYVVPVSHILSLRWFKCWVQGLMPLKCSKPDFLFLKPNRSTIGANFGTKIHIQHTKVTDAKFWQYANQISNAHAQYKLFLEEYTAIEFR